MIFRQKSTKSAAETLPQPAVGERIYAIGDIHGRGDLLQQMLRLVVEDVEDHPLAPNEHITLVYLGDYLDRGPDSKGVVDKLIAQQRLNRPGFKAIFLKGNHEYTALQFLRPESAKAAWLNYGGRETLQSYGVDPDIIEDLPYRWEAALPIEHRLFLENLTHSYTSGDYFFAHAGVRPKRPLAEQQPEDLLWIRQPFLKSKADHGKVIIHGHTIVENVAWRTNRIGIDTGAYATGRLTCLVLRGPEQRLIQTHEE